MSTSTIEHAPITFTHVEGPHRKRLTPSKRLGACVDELRSVQSLLRVLRDGLFSELHSADLEHYSMFLDDVENHLMLAEQELGAVLDVVHSKSCFF